jgi:tRNA threonylcarbamoyladenosine biosynthesis protein TsaB
MLILGVDTSGKHGSIALVDCGALTLLTLDVAPLAGGTFSAQLVPQISALLPKHGLTKQQIEAFAVVSGPGSFTGLRVGLAAIKALAEILQKPIAAVSLLEAVALAAGVDGRVIAALDAGRDEVYVGTYDVQNGRAACVSEQLLRLAELIAAAGRQIVTSDQKLADSVGQASLTVTVVPQQKADAIARLGFEKIRAGQVVPPEALDATYIRRSDAEIKFFETLK